MTSKQSAFSLRLQQFLAVLQSALIILTFAVPACVLSASPYLWRQPYMMLVGFVATFVFYFFSLCVGELGHYVGAKRASITILTISVMNIEIMPRRRGWRVRWSKPLAGTRFVSQVVYALDPRRPMRNSILLVTASAPLANVLVGVLCIGLGAKLPGWNANVAMAFGLSNLINGLVNLVPTVHRGASAGAVLLAWWRGLDEHAPNLAFQRLQAHSVAGVTASQTAPEDIAQLSTLGKPFTLIALWYRLQALQERGDWSGAVALGAELKSVVDDFSAHECAMAKPLIIFFEGDLAFAQAFLHKDPSLIPAAFVKAEIDWATPSFRPRRMALIAALAGDEAQTLMWLERAIRIADNSLDLSVRATERLLAGHIKALLTAPSMPDPEINAPARERDAEG